MCIRWFARVHLETPSTLLRSHGEYDRQSFHPDSVVPDNTRTDRLLDCSYPQHTTSSLGHSPQLNPFPKKQTTPFEWMSLSRTNPQLVLILRRFRTFSGSRSYIGVHTDRLPSRFSQPKNFFHSKRSNRFRPAIS